MRIVFGDYAPRIAGLTQAQGFDWSVEETPLAGGSVVTPGFTFEDITYSKVDLTSVANNCRIRVADSYLEPGHSFNSLTPEIATVDSDGNVAWVSNGAAEIIISTPRAGSKRFTRVMSSGGGSATFSRFQSFATGSLGAHCVAQIKALIAGKTPGSATQRYWSNNSGGVSAPSGTRNTGNFAASVDLSGISMCMTGRDTEMFPVMLISNRHAISARHTCPAVGTSVVFQRVDGSYQTVTIAGLSHLSTDMSVLYFDAAVTGITPFMVPPSNFAATYAPSMLGGPTPYSPSGHLPTLRKAVWNNNNTPESWLGVGNCKFIPPEGSLYNLICGVSPDDSVLLPWFNSVGGGDSGSPNFLVINGAPILLGPTSNPSVAVPICVFVTAINAAMNTLAGTVDTYALTHPDLSEFNTY